MTPCKWGIRVSPWVVYCWILGWVCWHHIVEGRDHHPDLLTHVKWEYRFPIWSLCCPGREGKPHTRPYAVLVWGEGDHASYLASVGISSLIEKRIPILGPASVRSRAGVQDAHFIPTGPHWQGRRALTQGTTSWLITVKHLMLPDEKSRLFPQCPDMAKWGKSMVLAG